MPYKQRSFEDGAVGQIRGHLGTLDRSLQASIHAHGHPVQSVYDLADYLTRRTLELRDAFPESAEVVRWATKFEAFVADHKLD